MRVTLIADASYKDPVAAWAGWARSDRGVVGVKAGIIREAVSSSGEAELYALCNTLAMAVRHDVLRAGDRVLFQTDNMAAVQLIAGLKDSNLMAPRKCLSGTQKARRFLYSALRGMKLTYDVRHIKAHSGTGSPRLYIHDVCDKLARRAMRSAFERYCRCPPASPPPTRTQA